ncbi:transcriptional regulator [Microbacterium sp. Mu-80]|uniref:Transcriptional regulator n=1 Tax=Microbacterium bandirmense TaxID=3122050 RepID=A0ABU8LH47_9MICO
MSDGSAPRHPRLRLDDSFASPIRFSLMAALGGDLELDFATLGSILQVSDSVLSKSISALEGVGYVSVRKGQIGTRPRTWVRGTTTGHRGVRLARARLAGDRRLRRG